MVFLWDKIFEDIKFISENLYIYSDQGNLNNGRHISKDGFLEQGSIMRQKS